MNYAYNIRIISFFLSYNVIDGTKDSYVAGGKYVEYNKYPHSVLLIMSCKHRSRCGGSILNQQLVLTAGHCLMHCQSLKNENIYVKYGHHIVKKMKQTKTKDYIVHPKFDNILLINDICLLLTKERIQLNSKVKRVILMKKPPVYREGFVAGWGHDETETQQQRLKYTKQLLQNPKICKQYGMKMTGSFCAGPIKGLGYANAGDSGSALVVKGYIQIGIVSYRKPSKVSLVGYTDISVYLNWIKSASRKIYCKKGKKEKKNKKGKYCNNKKK